MRRLFAAHDAKAVREGYGQLPVWFSRLPAQPRKRQVRTVFVSAGLAACLAPVFGPPKGSARCRHLGRESLAVFETPWRTAYHYDLFRGDVGHTLILGATGSGKSFALNFLLVEALKYGPRVLILDLGGSYRWLTRFLRGLLPRAHARRRRRVRAQAPALRVARGHAHVPVPDRLGAPAAQARGL